MNKNDSIKLPELPPASVLKIPIGEHPYPHRVAHFFREMILAQYTYELVKRASLQAILKYPDGPEKIREQLRIGVDGGLREDIFTEHWQFEQRFREMRRVWDDQEALFLLSSSWDFFIRRLIPFVEKAQSANGQVMQGKHKKIAYKPFEDQIEWLDNLCGTPMPDQEALSTAGEMFDVRHLGVHNAWEVDQKYLNKHKESRFRLREIRIVERNELFSFQRAMLAIVDHYTSAIAKQFSGASVFL